MLILIPDFMFKATTFHMFSSSRHSSPSGTLCFQKFYDSVHEKEKHKFSMNATYCAMKIMQMNFPLIFHFLCFQLLAFLKRNESERLEGICVCIISNVRQQKIISSGNDSGESINISFNVVNFVVENTLRLEDSTIKATTDV